MGFGNRKVLGFRIAAMGSEDFVRGCFKGLFTCYFFRALERALSLQFCCFRRVPSTFRELSLGF